MPVRNFTWVYRECLLTLSGRERYGHAFRLLLAGNRYLVVSDALGVHSLLRDKQKAFTTFPVHRLMTKTVGRVTQDFDVVQIMMERLFPIINKECSPEHLDRLAFSFNGELSRQFGAVDDQVRALPTSLVTPLSSFITKHLYCAASKTVFGPLFPFETFADFEYLEKNITSLLSLSHLLVGRWLEFVIDFSKLPASIPQGHGMMDSSTAPPRWPRQ